MNYSIFGEIIDDFMLYVPKLPPLLLIIVVGSFVIRLLQRVLQKMMVITGLNTILLSFINAFLGFACWVFIISLSFSILGFPSISLAFSGSIALIIVGVASNASSLIQDLLAGIFLIAEPEFTIGTKVRVNNIVGTVVGLDIKKTKIMDLEGNIHVISNKVFDSSIYCIEKKVE